MCGLAAIQFFPQIRKPGQWQAIKELFTENLLANEERGREASGVALISAKGWHIVLKRAVPASSLVRTGCYKKFLSYLNSDTICLLGHTRRPTKGAPINNVNNHPILTDYIIGIHNGHIDNDDELFIQNKLKRNGEVDSEIIFQLMNQLDPAASNVDNYIHGIKNQISRFEGKYAFLFVDTRMPSRLIVVKENQPLSYHWDQNYNALFFSSRYLFLRKAFGPSVKDETIAYKGGYCFDSKLLLNRNGRPAKVFQI